MPRGPMAAWMQGQKPVDIPRGMASSTHKSNQADPGREGGIVAIAVETGNASSGLDYRQVAPSPRLAEFVRYYDCADVVAAGAASFHHPDRHRAQAILADAALPSGGGAEARCAGAFLDELLPGSGLLRPVAFHRGVPRAGRRRAVPIHGRARCYASGQQPRLLSTHVRKLQSRALNAAGRWEDGKIHPGGTWSIDAP